MLPGRVAPARISSRSVSFTCGSSSGRSRNQMKKKAAQTAPPMPRIQNARCQPPPRSIRPPMTAGAKAPPHRLDNQMKLWAVARSRNGNQRPNARAMFGLAPASPAPNRNRIIKSAISHCSGPRRDEKMPAIHLTAPVAAVKSDQQRTMRKMTLRAPHLSPSQPTGTSNNK